MTNQLYPLQLLCVFLIAFTPSLLSAQCISGNCTNGSGTFVYPSGAKYTGDFVNSRSHGQGICYYTNNSKYQGSWKNGYPEGSGKKTLANGEEWIGQWRKGQPYDQNGTKVQLSKTAPPQDKYDINKYKAPDLLIAKEAGEGCIEGNCYNGQGTYIYQGHSARYIGAFRNELPHGYGTIVYASGDQYEGNWANGSFDGQGILYLGSGGQIAGLWSNGRHMKNATKARPQNNTPSRPSNVWAVIVGVSSYNHMPTLKFTDDDAYRMYAFLKSPEGGALADDHLQVLIDEDATRNKILGALENIFLKAGSNDLVLLYFSGHGLQGSFLPSDFDGFNNKILHEEINSIFQRSQAKYKLCIADACHSGSLLAMKGTTSENTVAKYYKTLAQSSPGTALILSSKSNETSLESSGLRQGVFSHFLIRGLKGEADGNFDKIVTIQELFDYTDYNVRTYTGSRQSPVIKGNYDRNMPAAVVR